MVYILPVAHSQPSELQLMPCLSAVNTMQQLVNGDYILILCHFHSVKQSRARRVD